MITWVSYTIMGVKQAGGYVIEVNPEETGISELADIALRGSASELMPKLLD